MIDIVGWVGAFLLAICGLPQFIKSLSNTKSTKGLSLLFLYIWLIGEILTLIYVIVRAPKWPLLLNYVFNIFIISGILTIYFLYKDKENQNLLKRFEYHIIFSESFMYLITAIFLICMQYIYSL